MVEHRGWSPDCRHAAIDKAFRDHRYHAFETEDKFSPCSPSAMADDHCGRDQHPHETPHEYTTPSFA
jgi:hypothetical protein